MWSRRPRCDHSGGHPDGSEQAAARRRRPPAGILDPGMSVRGDPPVHDPSPSLARTRGRPAGTQPASWTAAHRWRAVCRSRCDGPARGGRVRVASEPPPCCARFTSTLSAGPRKGDRPGRGLRRRLGCGHDVRPDEPSPLARRKVVQPVRRKVARREQALRCRGPAFSTGSPVVLRRAGSPVVWGPSDDAPRKRVSPAGTWRGSPTPRAQPRRFGLARSDPHRSVRTPMATERTHAPPGPPRGSGGRSLPLRSFGRGRGQATMGRRL